MKALFTIVFLLNFTAYAQNADFIVLKKRYKTIQTYFAGNEISITTTTGANITARISGMKSDSIFLQEFIVNRLVTTIGTYINDTAGSFRYAFHYKQIKAIGERPGMPHKGFDLKGSGGALLGGGALLTVGSGIVYLVDRSNFSPSLLLSSIGLGTIGYFLSKGTGKTGYEIGRKYKLVYMDMSK